VGSVTAARGLVWVSAGSLKGRSWLRPRPALRMETSSSRDTACSAVRSQKHRFSRFHFYSGLFPAIHDIRNDDTWRSGQNGAD
jgi:thiosulfate reductase cytochrome b subunit